MSPINPSSRSLLSRLLLPGIVVAAMAVAFGLGLHHYLSLQSLAENREALRSLTSSNLLLALFAYIALYVVAVALSIPGAVILTIAGGFLFGWLLGGTVTVLAATLGAVILFQVAKTTLGDFLVKRAGPTLTRLKDGFAEDAFSYLLFLRLVPAFPFWLVNIAPALAHVKLRTFALATAIGIIPGTFAFSFVGAGLDSIIEAQSEARSACVAEKGIAACPFNLSVSSLITTELLLAFAALGVVALIPVALKKWKART